MEGQGAFPERRPEAGACRECAGVGRAAKRVRQRKRADAEAGTDSTELGGKADTHTGNLEPGRGSWKERPEERAKGST